MRSNNKKVAPRTTVFLTILSALLIFTSLPVYGIMDSDDSTSAPASPVVTPVEDVFVIAEDATKRNEFEKHYYCSDGSFVAVTYPEAVHYQDDDGNWVNVDNRPAINSTEKTYEMVNGNFKVSFPDYSPESNSTSATSPNLASPQDRLVSMETDSHVLSWSLVAHKSVSVPGSMTATSEASLQPLSVSSASDLYAISDIKPASEPETTAFAEQVNIKDKTVFELPNASGKVAVSNIFGVDEPVSVEYTVYRNKIEEDIYIHGPTDIEAYSMVINCGSLTPQLNDDNSVDFLDNNGEMIYHISIPYMVDAVYETTQNIEVSLLHKGSQCIISYTPDQEWLHDESRVYPILLDPSVTTNEYTSAIYDTYVEENSTTNHSSEQAMYINKNVSTRRKALIFIHKLPGIGPSVPITSAELTLTTAGYLYTDVPVKLESFDSTLFIDYMSYSLLLSYAKTTVATDTLEAHSETDPLNWNAKRLCFDLTDHVSTMYQQLSSTCGCRFALSLQDEDSPLLFPAIYSTESTDVSLRPYLTITYGYTIPENLKNDCIVAVYNGGGTGYLYPHNGLLVDNNNLLHHTGVSSDSTYVQYILSRNPATGGYTLTHTNAPSSGFKITADTNTKRVFLHSQDDPTKQEWLIVPYMSGYRIVLRTDMQYALYAVGAASGYNDDQTITTDGHVILKKYTGNMDYRMMWIFQKKSDYWNKVYARGLYISGNKFEIIFSVKKTGDYNIKTLSTKYSNDHLTNIVLSTHNTVIEHPLQHNNSMLGGESLWTVKSALNQVPLTAGTLYKLSVTNYSETANLNCLLKITYDSIPTPVDNLIVAHDYSVIEFDEYYTDYIDTTPPHKLGELPLINYFTCLRYAFTTYDNHYFNTRFIYNTYITDSQIGYVYHNESLNNVKNNASKLGYIYQDFYSPNCIILYQNAHYAVSINGVITAKNGQGVIMEHTTYDVYYNSWEPIGYFVRE